MICHNHVVSEMKIEQTSNNAIFFHWIFQKYSVMILFASIVLGNSEIMHCGILINMPDGN